MKKILFVLLSFICLNVSATEVDTVKNVVKIENETFTIIKRDTPYNKDQKTFIIKDNKGNFGYMYLVSFFDTYKLFIDIRDKSIIKIL